jgi:transposase-like protein
MPGRNYSRQFKLACIHQVTTGQKGAAQRCCERGIDQSTLLRWRTESASAPTTLSKPYPECPANPESSFWAF